MHYWMQFSCYSDMNSKLYISSKQKTHITQVMFVAKQRSETFQLCLIPHWNKEGSCECLDFTLLMIKKMKHQFYDYLEFLTNPQKNCNQQFQDKDLDLILEPMDEADGVDSLAILECKIFQKYEHAIQQLINKNISHKEELENIMREAQGQEQGQVQQLNRNAIIEEIVQKVRKMLENSDQLNQSIENTLFEELLKSLQNQTKFTLNLSSNFLNIKINTQENIQTNQNPNSPTRLISISDNEPQNEELSPNKPPSQQDFQNQDNLPNQKYQTAQRQLQFLIKQKQLQKRLHDTLQEVDQLKTLLQEKERLLSQKDTQLKQMIKNLEKQNLIKNRQEKVKSLKDKVEKESLIRELGFERQRDNFQLFIHKENIDSNIINTSEIKKTNKLCSASRNFINSKISSPKITQFPN